MAAQFKSKIVELESSSLAKKHEHQRSSLKRKYIAVASQIVYYTLALIGCLWQLFDISQEYLAYDAVTQLTIRRPKRIIPPSLVICIDYVSLLNETTKPRVANLTLDNILDISPEYDKLTTNCSRHETDGYAWHEVNCSSAFKVTKFVKQGYTCYDYTLSSNASISYRHLTNSFYTPHVFRIIWDPLLITQVNYMTFYMKSPSRQLRGNCDAFAENTRDIVDAKTGESEQNAVWFTYATFNSVLLPLPYKTRCRNYTDSGFKSQEHCYEKCVRNLAVQEINKMPFSIRVTRTTQYRNLTVISGTDIENVTLAKQLSNLEKRCDLNCESPDCNEQDIVPRIIANAKGFKPEFTVYASNEPDITTRFKPKVTMVEFLTYVLSIVGCWLGISPLGALIGIDVFGRLRDCSCFSGKQSDKTNENKNYETPRRSLKRENQDLRRNVTAIWNVINVQRQMINDLSFRQVAKTTRFGQAFNNDGTSSRLIFK